MKKIFLITIALFLNHAFACLNGETKILKNGYHIYEDFEGIVPNGHDFRIENSHKLLRELDSLYRATKDIAYLSDKGYVLVILKKYNEAIKIYSFIEKEQPNRYSTASNLGTIYELIGDNNKAYYWIERAMKINPKSHESSEWLHLKILEAKIKGENYVNSEFLINTKFRNDTIPSSELDNQQQQKLIRALYYQLNERISFIKNDDKIIALLLNDLASLAWIQKNYWSTIEILKLSKEYGMDADIIEKRIDLVTSEFLFSMQNEIGELYHINEYHKSLVLYLSIAVGILLLFLIILLIRKTAYNRNQTKSLNN